MPISLSPLICIIYLCIFSSCWLSGYVFNQYLYLGKPLYILWFSKLILLDIAILAGSHLPSFIISSFLPQQCSNMHGQPIYGDSPVVPLLGSPRCLCYCYPQDCTVFLYAILHFLSFPLFLIPCTPPSRAIFGYLQSFILVT